MGSFRKHGPPPLAWPILQCVLLRLGEQQNVMVVPSQAVQAGQQGQLCFRRETEHDRGRPASNAWGKQSNNETQILQGLSVGETVVTDGQVTPGSGHEGLLH